MDRFVLVAAVLLTFWAVGGLLVRSAPDLGKKHRATVKGLRREVRGTGDEEAVHTLAQVTYDRKDGSPQDGEAEVPRGFAIGPGDQVEVVVPSSRTPGLVQIPRLRGSSRLRNAVGLLLVAATWAVCGLMSLTDLGADNEERLFFGVAGLIACVMLAMTSWMAAGAISGLVGAGGGGQRVDGEILGLAQRRAGPRTRFMAQVAFRDAIGSEQQAWMPAGHLRTVEAGDQVRIVLGDRPRLAVRAGFETVLAVVITLFAVGVSCTFLVMMVRNLLA